MASRIRKTLPKDNVPATKDKPDTSTTWLIDTENETSNHACTHPDIQTGDDVWWLNHTCKEQNALDSQIATLLGNLVKKGTKSHRYVVMTNDESLDAAVAFWRARGYDISRTPLACPGQAR